MLVLTRKKNQDIFIGDNIKVTVLKVKGNTVRLGVEAPRDVRVVRGELPKKEEPQMAEVTIVFNDTNEKPVDDRSMQLLPFCSSRTANLKAPQSRSEKSGTANSGTVKRSRNQNEPTTESSTTRKTMPANIKTEATTRQVLPANLSTNRLKEILAELSGQ